MCPECAGFNVRIVHYDFGTCREQAFDGYRAKRFRRTQGRLTLQCTVVTNGKLSTGFRRAARERDIEVYGGSELLRLLDSRRCTAVDIEAANSQRLASMRDVQAKIDSLVDR
jgi:hypothetical protein